MSPEQLVGLAECLPDGYPREGGVVVVFGRKGRSRKSRRKRVSRKAAWIPWYQQWPRW